MRRMMCVAMLLWAASVCGVQPAACAEAHAKFSFEDRDGALTLLDGGKRVLTYHYETVPAPEGVKENFARAGYIHPLYGIDGEVLTDDFPADHRHHRGVFWAWPECTVDGRRLDVWALLDSRQHHEKWLLRKIGRDHATIGVRNRWAFDDAPDKAVVREEVFFTVHAAEDGRRAIDFRLKFTNVSGREVTFLGAKNKGYGGLCYRPDASEARRPITFTHVNGQQMQGADLLRYDTPWADLTSTSPGGGRSGVAIFQNAKNPGYPHPGWIMRHYGFLGASWPHEDTHKLQPGQSFELRYRMLVHRGTADEATVAELFRRYVEGR